MQIATAARLTAISWMFSLQFWILNGLSDIHSVYAIIDGLIAIVYFQMSRRRWFPVPLFFLHAMLVLYHLYAWLIGPSPFWVQVFLNRSFEVALAYIFACALFRILHHNNNSGRA